MKFLGLLLLLLLLLLNLNLFATTDYALPLPAPVAADSLSTKPTDSLVIEAEAGAGEWERLEESGAVVIRAVPGKSMTYQVSIAEAGVYYVHLRCRLTSGMKGPDGRLLDDTSTNDAHVTVGGQRLYGT